MNELMLSLADKLDMTYDGIVKAYPEIANQIMYYNIIDSFRPLIILFIIVSIVTTVTLVLHSHDKPDGLGTLVVELESQKRTLNHAMAYEELYGESEINKMEQGIKDKQIEIKELEDANKAKYNKHIKYSVSVLVVSVSLMLVSVILTSILAKDFIALTTILSGLK